MSHQKSFLVDVVEELTALLAYDPARTAPRTLHTALGRAVELLVAIRDNESAIAAVVTERARQRTAEGHLLELDDQYTDGALAAAAACYANNVVPDDEAPGEPPGNWPWDRAAWKPTPNDRRRELVKAGALILAEIERLDRATVRAREGEQA